MNPWVVVALVGAATVAIKAAGPVLIGGRQLPSRALGAIRLLAPALLAALVVTQAVGASDRPAMDERLLGLAAAVLALVLRAPILVVVLAAAATTALARLVV
ncbi:MAG: AzlD domain-containing protein [Egibacteraceae bacterium]